MAIAALEPSSPAAAVTSQTTVARAGAVGLEACTVRAQRMYVLPIASFARPTMSGGVLLAIRERIRRLDADGRLVADWPVVPPSSLLFLQDHGDHAVGLTEDKRILILHDRGPVQQIEVPELRFLEMSWNGRFIAINAGTQVDVVEITAGGARNAASFTGQGRWAVNTLVVNRGVAIATWTPARGLVEQDARDGRTMPTAGRISWAVGGGTAVVTDTTTARATVYAVPGLRPLRTVQLDEVPIRSSLGGSTWALVTASGGQFLRVDAPDSPPVRVPATTRDTLTVSRDGQFVLRTDHRTSRSTIFTATAPSSGRWVPSSGSALGS